MRIAMILAACVAVATGMSGCATGGSADPQPIDTRATLTGISVAGQLALAMDSGDPEQIEIAFDLADELLAVWGEDDPNVKAIADMSSVALTAWRHYAATGEGDWRAAVLSLITAINRHELDRMRESRDPPTEPVEPPAEPDLG